MYLRWVVVVEFCQWLTYVDHINNKLGGESELHVSQSPVSLHTSLIRNQMSFKGVSRVDSDVLHPFFGC